MSLIHSPPSFFRLFILIRFANISSVTHDSLSRINIRGYYISPLRFGHFGCVLAFIAVWQSQCAPAARTVSVLKCWALCQNRIALIYWKHCLISADPTFYLYLSVIVFHEHHYSVATLDRATWHVARIFLKIQHYIINTIGFIIIITSNSPWRWTPARQRLD